MLSSESIHQNSLCGISFNEVCQQNEIIIISILIYFRLILKDLYHTLNLANKTVIRFIEKQKLIIYINTIMKIDIRNKESI